MKRFENYPCNEECITFASCLQKHPREKVKSCTIFRDYISGEIDKHQERSDKENNPKSVRMQNKEYRLFTVIAVETPDGVIDKCGQRHDVPVESLPSQSSLSLSDIHVDELKWEEES